MTNVLDNIVKQKHREVAERQACLSLADIKAKVSGLAPTRGFVGALRAKVEAGQPGLIAEIKRASPSRGLIRADFNPRIISVDYARGGAACLSVLTDMKHFQGHDDHLKAARGACDLPVLRKDFIVEPYQVFESRAIGADCVLLIAASLSDAELQDLEGLAGELGMDVLVEVHDEAELERALKLRAKLIGINNRDLKTLKVDLAVTERLAPMVHQDRIVVCESGIDSHADLRRMASAGAHCFLVGEGLMRHADITAATRALLGVEPASSAAE